MYLFSRLMQADPDTAGGAGPDSGAGNEPADLDSTIGALFDKMQADGKVDEAGALVDAEDEAGETAAEPKAVRARDTTGKFAKPAAEAADSAETGKDAAKPAAELKTEASAAATQFTDAPKSWNATERAAWAATPEAVRAAAHRREEDFHRGIEQYKGKAQTFDALHAVIAPHAKIFETAGQNAVDNIGGLLNLQQVLYTGSEDQKIGTLLQIASNIGIKPEVLLEGLQNPRQQPAQDPRYDTLARELQQTRQMLSQVQAAPVQSEIERFFADTKNEHLAEPGVTEQMLMLIQSGVAKTVQEAYDKACRLSDTVQAKVSAKSAEAERKAQAERDAAEAKRKADLAAKATRASSINVKPRGATAGPAAKGTMDDTIASIYDRIHGSGN